MANTRQARKRARQAETRRQHNASLRSRMRSAIKTVLKAIGAGNREQAESAYRAAVPLIDRTAGRGLIHPNKAARHKARLNKHVRSLAS